MGKKQRSDRKPAGTAQGGPVHRYVPFFDLVSDAVFHHLQAKEAAAPFAQIRHARAAVVAAALSIECVANCILEDVEAPRSVKEALDRLETLAKLETALVIVGSKSFEKGRIEIEKAAELIAARNRFVHPRTTSASVEVSPPEDAGEHWVVPFVMEATEWPKTGIPHHVMQWSTTTSESAVKAIAEFHRYVLIEVLSLDAARLHQLLSPMLRMGDVSMPMGHYEVSELLDAAKAIGADFTFLRPLLYTEAPPESDGG